MSIPIVTFMSNTTQMSETESTDPTPKHPSLRPNSQRIMGPLGHAKLSLSGIPLDRALVHFSLGLSLEIIIVTPFYLDDIVSTDVNDINNDAR